jgi:hypothetical protein
VLSVSWEKGTCGPTKNSVLIQDKILPTISPICGVNQFISQHCTGDILIEKKNDGIKIVEV